MEKGIVNVLEFMHGIGDWGVCVLVAELFGMWHLFPAFCLWDEWMGFVGRIGTIDDMDRNQISVG